MNTNESNLYVEFKFLKNQMCSFADGKAYHVPMRMVHKQVPMPDDPNKSAPMPSFDMNATHRISLGNCDPILPKRTVEMSDNWYAKLEAAAFEAAIKARADREEILAKVRNYVSQGVIEVVSCKPSDLFELESLTEAEKLAAGIETKKPATVQQAAKEMVNKEIARHNQQQKSGGK